MKPAPGQVWKSKLNQQYEIEKKVILDKYYRYPGWIYTNGGWDRDESFADGTLVFVGWAPGKQPHVLEGEWIKCGDLDCWCVHTIMEREVMKNQIWFVWKEGGGSPVYQHLSLSTARAEAERLARQLGGKFFVCHAVAVCERQDVVWKTLTDEEISF